MKYTVTATDSKGKTRKLDVSAPSESIVIDGLGKKGFTNLTITEVIDLTPMDDHGTTGTNPPLAASVQPGPRATMPVTSPVSASSQTLVDSPINIYRVASALRVLIWVFVGGGCGRWDSLFRYSLLLRFV